ESSSDEQRVSVMALNSFLLLGIGALGGLIGGAVPEIVGQITHLSATSVVPLRWGVLSASIIVFLPAIPLFWLRDLPRNGAPHRHAGVQGTGLADEAATPAQMAAPLTTPSATTPDIMPNIERGNGQGGWALVALFVMLLLPDLLESTGQGAVVGLLQLYFYLRFALGPGAIGVLSATAGLLCGVMALSAPRIVRRYGKLRTITSVQFLLAPVVLIIGFSPLFAFAAVAEFARNTLRGIFEPVYATFAMERVAPRRRSTLSGFYSLTWSVGNSIGPGVAGWLQVHVGLSAAFVVGAVCEALAGACLLFFFRHTQGVD
ncbi:MAG: MFS transporter, partial [Ktedonobacterales bacterium]